jgi:hypothetical protein
LDVTDEDISQMLVSYRSTATEELTPGLDKVILGAASRRAVRVRTIRRSVVGLALAVVIILPYWETHMIRTPQARGVSDYGRQEGATRYYLLDLASVPYTGPGSEEHRQ